MLSLMIGSARAGSTTSAASKSSGMDQLETQTWNPTASDLLAAWGDVEKKEMELRNREAELREFEEEHARLKSQEKLRKQLRLQEDRRAAAVAAQEGRIPEDEKPAASPETRDDMHIRCAWT